MVVELTVKVGLSVVPTVNGSGWGIAVQPIEIDPARQWQKTFGRPFDSAHLHNIRQFSNGTHQAP